MLIKACREVSATQRSIQQKTQAVLNRMLDKAQTYIEAEQYLLAEQMYEAYIARCEDNFARADAEIKKLAVCVLAGDKERATNQLNTLVGKMRSGEYVLNAEQKQSLAESKLGIMRL
ncbi:MAG: hypothetical protein GX802_05410 [Clostridiales bacterium]|nr:hypothetical protein [Clostridiales bacterium]